MVAGSPRSLPATWRTDREVVLISTRRCPDPAVGAGPGLLLEARRARVGSQRTPEMLRSSAVTRSRRIARGTSSRLRCSSRPGMPRWRRHGCARPGCSRTSSTRFLSHAPSALRGAAGLAGPAVLGGSLRVHPSPASPDVRAGSAPWRAPMSRPRLDLDEGRPTSAEELSEARALIARRSGLLVVLSLHCSTREVGTTTAPEPRGACSWTNAVERRGQRNHASRS